METLRSELQLSVIIPTYQEAEFIAPLIQRCYQEAEVQEVIVVDAGSSDGTSSIAESEGAKVYQTDLPGRACQMNIGADLAQGDILQFIHADAMPPRGFGAMICSEVEKGYHAGCFRSRFVTNSKFLLANSFFTRFNGIIFRGGGQTLFCKANLFNQVGGYEPQLQVMEEYELIQRLQKHSHFRVIQEDVLVSARKYQRKGTIKLQMAYAVIFVLFFLGTSQAKLVKLYKRLIS